MLNTVFKKLMAIYFIITVVTFLILGLLFSQMFSNYFFNRHEQALVSEGRKMNDMITDYLEGELDDERLNMELRSIERFLNTRIWVMDKKGVIYGVSSEEAKWIGKQVTETDILNVLKGNIIVKKGIIKSIGNTPMVTVGIPIFVGGKVDSAIIMYSPLYEITSAIQEVHRIIWTAMTICFIISFIIIYIMSKRFSEPIQQMGDVSKKIAKGDFTQRVEYEEGREDEIGQVTQTFNEMADQLEKIEDNRRSFISALAHELRSPLTLIKGFVQGMVDGTVKKEEHDKYLQIILSETKRLTQMITNLLDIQRMESSQYPIYPQVFDMNELIVRTLMKYEEEIERLGIQVNLDLSKTMKVYADKDAYEQVLINLIDNAMKFMGENGKLHMKTFYKQHQAWVQIEDNGIGISEEKQKRIFKRFYKADRSRDRNKTGTGLGLYIVKKIVDRHEQTIKVESIVDKGTIFTFSLPCKK